MKSTNSQIAERFMMNTYPCLRFWLDFLKKAVPDAFAYDATSCAQLALMSSNAMKTFDYIASVDPNANNIQVSKMLFQLHEVAWSCWTSFTSVSRTASGSKSLLITSSALQAMSTLSDWDSSINPRPSDFNPASLLEIALKGVTL